MQKKKPIEKYLLVEGSSSFLFPKELAEINTLLKWYYSIISKKIKVKGIHVLPSRRFMLF